MTFVECPSISCTSAAEQVVTFAKTDSATGQTLVIDGGRFFH